MNILIICVHIIVCLVLISVILLQTGRGQGLTGGSFGGGNVQSLFGTKASSFLTKATTVCAILFIMTCIALNILEVHKSRSLFKSSATQAPLDVEQIKKALEKVKKTDDTAAVTTEASEAAKADVAKLTEGVQQTAADTTATGLPKD